MRGPAFFEPCREDDRSLNSGIGALSHDAGDGFRGRNYDRQVDLLGGFRHALVRLDSQDRFAARSHSEDRAAKRARRQVVQHFAAVADRPFIRSHDRNRCGGEKRDERMVF